MKRADMALSQRAHKAVLDTGAADLNADGREMLTDGNPEQGAGQATNHATQDTARNARDAVPNSTGAVPPINKAAGTRIADIDAMVKAGRGHVALIRRKASLMS